MNLPISIDDPSLAGHEPLSTRLAMLHSYDRSSRSAATQAGGSFIKSMQENVQAAAAALKWAALLFGADASTLELMDDGSGLYTAFLEYQRMLLKGPDDANTCAGRITKNGLDAIKLKNTKGAVDTALEPGRAKDATYVTDQGGQCSSDSHTTSGSKHDPGRIEIRAQAPGTEAQQPPPFNTTGGTTSILPEAAKSKKRSARKREKKRKASSQNPPVIAPSDASEDDREPSKTRAVTAASAVSHRTKRIVTNPRPPGEPTHKSERIQLPREETNISEAQLCHTGPHSDNFVSSLSSKGGGGAQTAPSGRKHKGSLNAWTQVTRSSSTLKKVRKMKLTGMLAARANKRLRRALTLDGEGEGLDIAHPRFLEEPTVQRTVGTDCPSTQGVVHKASNTRKKRTRLEFEGEFVACHKTPSANSNELLGPDIRSKRPLPRKVCKRRSAPVMGEDTSVRGVPRGESSLEYVERVLRDEAGNALAQLREEVGPDVPDWTQTEEQDVDCDDQDEVNDAQVDPPTCAPTSAVPKPPLLAPPRIWAQTRQEVCESFEYFRSYHGGVYFKDDIVRGYLLGAHAASRDILRHDGKLIISHGGGKSDSILPDRCGKAKHQPDQDQQASDKSVRALLRTYEDKRPIVLLADDRYALFPYDLTAGNHAYVVLGFYWITHAWAECQSTRDGSGRVIRWKFAFQWCEGQGDPWWLPQQELTGTTPDPQNISDSSTEDSVHHANTCEASTIRCETCQKQSPFVYGQGWMCLNPQCEMFWRIDGEDPKQLDYREEFLKLLPDKLQRLPEITPTRVVKTQDGVTTTYAFSKGLHCTNCGRLSCRFKWEHWECSNCQFKHVVTGRARSPKEFWHQRPPADFMHSRIAKDSGIIACRLEPINLGPQKGFTSRLTFILPHDKGKIHLVLATPLSNREADDIFQLYQRQASTGELKLRRYPLRSHRVRGQLLTNYFSQNSGEPYQYVGGTGNTVPFSAAPECVRRALAVIKERSSLALHSDIPYNEILSAAYMERQKMSFHSDSEKGLGPTVASLSLGSAALMHFRLRGNAENPTSKNRCSHALTLVLRHGDVLIMEGEGVQKYYEHTVVPMNFRIAATARCIGST